VKDTIVLVLEHDFGDGDGDAINASRISKILAGDWGFYHTVTTNLVTVERHLDRYDALSNSQRSLVLSRLDRLLRRIEAEPKSLRWKARAKVGTRAPWYQVVEAKEP
jgi:hypothetical protein